MAAATLLAMPRTAAGISGGDRLPLFTSNALDA